MKFNETVKYGVVRISDILNSYIPKYINMSFNET